MVKSEKTNWWGLNQTAQCRGRGWRSRSRWGKASTMSTWHRVAWSRFSFPCRCLGQWNAKRECWSRSLWSQSHDRSRCTELLQRSNCSEWSGCKSEWRRSGRLARESRTAWPAENSLPRPTFNKLCEKWKWVIGEHATSNRSIPWRKSGKKAIMNTRKIVIMQWVIHSNTGTRL